MKSRLLIAFSSVLVHAGIGMTQSPALPVIPLLPQDCEKPTTLPELAPSIPKTLPPVDKPAIDCGPTAPNCPDDPLCCLESHTRYWASAEYLLWWAKSSPLPVPTLTTFAPGSASATTGFGGALGVNGTTILSPDHLGQNAFSGAQFLLGGWLDNDRRLGLEVSGFFTENRIDNWSNFSNASGSPPLRVPFFNVPPGAGFPLGESSFVLSSPGLANGGQSISSSLSLYGINSHFLLNVLNNDRFTVSVLGGFQFLDLSEGLTIVDRESLLTGAAFGTYTATDSFVTHNQFYGGQVGAKAEATYGWFFASALGTIALGGNDETVTINGSSTVKPGGGGPTVTSPAGIFAQATNIGRQNQGAFSVVPEAHLRMGVNLTSYVRLFVGYDFIYESDVVRPGDQIDRVLNFTGNLPLSGISKLSGAARPAPLFNHTDFWTQGLTFGLDFCF